MGDKLYSTLAELEMARKFEKVAIYTTTDGQKFTSEYGANFHQESLKPERLKLRDLLNQIIILTDRFPDDVYLTNVGTYTKRVIDSVSEAAHNEDQYYNSNCY